MGQVQLAAGTQATLDLSGEGLLNVVIDPDLAASITNDGSISAGYVRVGGGDAAGFVNAAINLNGVVEATGFDGQTGAVDVLTSGDLFVNGRIEALGVDAGDVGGTVKLLGDRVALLDDAVVDVSGMAGGGEVLVGGNYLGQGPEPNARAVYFSEGAQVSADALVSGDGGRVIVWSDEYTGFYGSISAQSSADGSGGFVETSSKINLQAFGDVQTSGGLWLLDPTNVEIVNDNTIGGGTGLVNVGLAGGTFTPAAASGRIHIGNINTALATGNVTVLTSGANGEDGDITFNDATNGGLTISANGGGANDFTLTLIAARDIVTTDTSVNNTGVVFEAVGDDQLNLVFAAGRNITMDGTITTLGVTFAFRRQMLLELLLLMQLFLEH